MQASGSGSTGARASSEAAAADEKDADTKVYLEYATVDGNQVMTSKRTKYRLWKEFENGAHSTSLVRFLRTRTKVMMPYKPYHDLIPCFLRTVVSDSDSASLPTRLRTCAITDAFPNSAKPDDTCVQPGYWSAVAAFVQSLAPLPDHD